MSFVFSFERHHAEPVAGFASQEPNPEMLQRLPQTHGEELSPKVVGDYPSSQGAITEGDDSHCQ